MRILHFADLHLGVENYGSIDPLTGMSTRVGDFLRSFDAIVERAISEPVDAVLFAGDAFKNRDPSPTIQREFARRIGKLAQHHVPIVLLTGNHDLPNATQRATANEVYQVLEIPGVYVCRNIDLLKVETRSGLLQVVTLPWFTRSLFLSREEYRIMAEVDLDRAMGRAISDSIAGLLSDLDPSAPAVLLAHLSVQGASLGFEQSIMLGKDVTIGLDEMRSHAFDYIALGHIHRHQFVGSFPPAVYSGSPERIDFGEEREPKGYVVVTVEEVDGERTAIPEFVELDVRPFLTLRVTAAGDTPMDAVERELSRASSEVSDAIVRCFVTVDTGRERAVSATDIRRRLVAMGACYVAQVVIESESTGRTRWELSDDSGRDSESMLQRWVEMKDFDPELRKRVLTRGSEFITRYRRNIDGGRGEDG